MLLINGKKGGKYTVLSLMLDKSLWRRLEAMGLTAGAPVEILNKKKSGSTIIRLRGTRYAIGAEIAMGIAVEERKGA
ncbi:MAG: ferrous iron transport protein A [Clostridia bacterium]